MHSFSKSEIKAYKTLVNYGQTSASQLSKVTGLYRTHVYDVLNSLINKGLVCYSENEKRLYYPTDGGFIKQVNTPKTTTSQGMRIVKKRLNENYIKFLGDSPDYLNFFNNSTITILIFEDRVSIIKWEKPYTLIDINDSDFAKILVLL